MKFYIKTLRSNLDNILSSESISPYSYYLKRGYGYNRFDRLKSDVNDNLLRIDTQMIEDEEDVVYIELNGEDEQIKSLVPKSIEDCFFISRPVYLYPWNCRILFKNAEDAKGSVFICKSSLTNKMWNYFPIGLIEKRDKRKLSYLKISQEYYESLAEEIEIDATRNRLKGFLYTYYWGAFRTLTPELARLLQTELKIYGLTVVLAGMRTPTADLVNEVERLKKVFNTYDPNRLILKNLWTENIINKFSTKEDGQLFENMISRLGVQKAAMDAFAKEQGVVVSPRLETTSLYGTNWRLFGKHLDEYTQHLIEKEIERNPLNKEQVKIEVNQAVFSKSDDKLYELALNEVISGNKWLIPERVSSKRMDVANDLAYFVKTYCEKYGGQWDGSAEQNYLDGLRKNIAFSEPFDPNQTTNKGLRALAIYVLKGDMFDDMIKYIQISGVEDYSLVLGLWGANIGYTNLPKTFMQRLALSQQKKDACYTISYTSLTEGSITATLNSTNFTDGIQRMTLNTVVFKKTPDELPVLMKMKQPPLKLSDEQVSIIKEVLNSNNGRIDENGLKAIGSIKGIGKKKLELIKEILKDLILPPKDNLLFSENYQSAPSRSISPSDVMRTIDVCLPNDFNVRKQVEKDVTWYLSRNYEPIDKMITGLCEYLYRNKYAKGSRLWVRRLYEHVDVSLIESKLRETFLK